MEQICKDIKSIHDSIHGIIELTKFAIKIIDTPIFQRLRYLKQLGTCNFIYQNAVHTRLEHSIGTYHLAKKLLEQIRKHIDANSDTNEIEKYLSSIPELKSYYDKTYDNKKHPLDNYVCELIKIAALCHDIGHGPFSHLFDDVFIPSVGKQSSKYATHEVRSCALLTKIIKSDDILSKIVTDDDIAFMCNIINPNKEIHKGFMYQIVSNNLNSLDVDKYDYLKRDSKVLHVQTSFDFSRLIEDAKVIDNNICYSEQSVYDILNLFHTRHYLHRQVYGHKGAIAAQYVISEILQLVDPILEISSSVDDLDKFILLTDDYILNSVKFLSMPKVAEIYSDYSENIAKATKLLNDLDYHKLYVYIDTLITKTQNDITPSDIINESGNKDICIDPNEIIIYRNKVGFVSGEKSNPLDNIYTYRKKDFYSNKQNAVAMKYTKEQITMLIPSLHQEYVTIIFFKDKSNKLAVNELKKIISQIKVRLT